MIQFLYLDALSRKNGGSTFTGSRLPMALVRKIKKAVMARSRGRKTDHFYSLCREGNSVLDVGVSSETRRGRTPHRNHFLKTFRYPSKYYTGLGVHDLSGMERLFPGKRFVQYRGGRFPFDDDEFDWAFSNAVIEHVGPEDAQLAFVNEMLRVARRIFFTTPYKFFPVEAHTDVAFLHWCDRPFYEWCAKHRPHIKPETLSLLSRHCLRSMMERSIASEFEIFSNRTLGMCMTLTVVARR